MSQDMLVDLCGDVASSFPFFSVATPTGHLALAERLRLDGIAQEQADLAARPPRYFSFSFSFGSAPALPAI
jgi:hypothetical protein